jgi:hypothetical protein
LNSAPRVEVAMCPTDVDQLDATREEPVFGSPHELANG